MDMKLNEFKLLRITGWNEKYQSLTAFTTEDLYTDRYRLGLKSLFVPLTIPF